MPHSRQGNHTKLNGIPTDLSPILQDVTSDNKRQTVKFELVLTERCFHSFFLRLRKWAAKLASDNMKITSFRPKFRDVKLA